MQRTRTRVRQLSPTDTIPFSSLQRGGVPIGWENLTLDPEWTWISENGSGITGLLICGYCFPFLLILRIAATPTASPATPLLLLRQAMRDARRRGLVGYLTFLSDSAAAEGALMRIVQRADGQILPSSGAWAFGKL